jgi:hypothetical protein
MARVIYNVIDYAVKVRNRPNYSYYIPLISDMA